MAAKQIHLQGYGKQHAKPAGDIKVGDVIMWNFGETSEVLGIERETEKQIIVSLKNERGFVGIRRMTKNRLVAYR